MSTNEKYLQGFDRLGEQIYFRNPTTRSTKQDDPDIILLCSWLYAKDRYISKYTDRYQKLFPDVPILLLKQDGPDMMWRPNSWQFENFAPAISAYRDAQARVWTKALVHVWSNGGAYTLTQFADAYAARCGRPLPIQAGALVIDSAPSAVGMRSGFTAMSQGFPSTWPQPVKLVLGGLTWSLMYTSAMVGATLFGSEGAVSGMRRKLNDVDYPFMGDDVRRMYIYSETDELIPWTHVEGHAKEAREKFQKLSGVKDLVRQEKFEGSKHVSHMMVDPDRYWKLILDFWTSRTSKPK